MASSERERDEGRFEEMDWVVRLRRIFSDLILAIANVPRTGEGLRRAMLNTLILTLVSSKRCVRLVIEKREGTARVRIALGWDSARITMEMIG